MFRNLLNKTTKHALRYDGGCVIVKSKKVIIVINSLNLGRVVKSLVNGFLQDYPKTKILNRRGEGLAFCRKTK